MRPSRSWAKTWTFSARKLCEMEQLKGILYLAWSARIRGTSCSFMHCQLFISRWKLKAPFQDWSLETTCQGVHLCVLSFRMHLLGPLVILLSLGLSGSSLVLEFFGPLTVIWPPLGYIGGLRKRGEWHNVHHYLAMQSLPVLYLRVTQGPSSKNMVLTLFCWLRMEVYFQCFSSLPLLHA